MRRSALLVATLLLAGCATLPPTTLADARAVWATRGSDDYHFTISRQCFCIDEYRGPFEVTVRDRAATVLREGAPADPRLLEGLPLDADALFAFAAEREQQQDFRATFDPTTGFLLSVWSDPIPEAVDEELGLTVTDFSLDR